MEEAQCIDALDQLNNSSITCQLPDSTLGFITHSLCKVKSLRLSHTIFLNHIVSSIWIVQLRMMTAFFLVLPSLKHLLHYTNLYSKDIFSRAFIRIGAEC